MTDDKQTAERLEKGIETAVEQGGAYEVLKARLAAEGERLTQQINHLNAARIEEFGKTDLEVIARVRARTENNCLARDIVRVGPHLLFGYNVFIGLKKETAVQDVFALYDLVEADSGYELQAVDITKSFLNEPGFVNDFNELYSYYKQSRLLELQVSQARLLAVFQIGQTIQDIRVFRWDLSVAGRVSYIDNRGEREILRPPSHDFEWIEVGRDDQVTGKHPHLSILDQVFIETIGGDLTIKIENNTEDGMGIYREPVEDDTQSLDDANIAYAKLGNLILLRVLPYREKRRRYFVFNIRTKSVVRLDAIGDACVQLPEDHGIIFPGGYYLQNGEMRIFDDADIGLRFRAALHSPNGEDVLYIFYEPVAGRVGLFSYNMIRKQLQNPILCHGYAVFDDGKIIIFTADHTEPSRYHPMQIWQTPYHSEEYGIQQPAAKSFFGRIGNAELVRGISDVLSLARSIKEQKPALRLYEEMLREGRALFDNFFWLEDPATGDLAATIKQIIETGELVLGEFEKVESIRRQADQALMQAEADYTRINSEAQSARHDTPESFVQALQAVRKQRGHLTTIRELRYIDAERILEMDQGLAELQEKLGRKAEQFLQRDDAFSAYIEQVENLTAAVEQSDTVHQLQPLIETAQAMGTGLDTLTSVLNALSVDDATRRTAILDAISNVYARLNTLKAQAQNRRKALASGEAVAEFGAQFKLLAQSVTHALSLATSPEACDEQLSRLLVQLEELESKFSEYDQFLGDIIEKREQIYESFEARKQALLEERQRRAHNLATAAARLLSNIERRALKFTLLDELNTYFASDSMVLKLRELVQTLRQQDAVLQADEAEARLQAIRQQAVRVLRDKEELFEDGGTVIKLGRHRFSAGSQTVDLTLLPRAEGLALHLTGTDYFQLVEDTELTALRSYWEQALPSETQTVYRAEYLAAELLQAAEMGHNELDLNSLSEARNDATLNLIVQKFAAARYQEGYVKGVHDQDATLILTALLDLRESAGLLRFTPEARALALLFWARSKDQSEAKAWRARALSVDKLINSLRQQQAFLPLRDDLVEALQRFVPMLGQAFEPALCTQAAHYLSLALTREPLAFDLSAPAYELAQSLQKHLDRIGHVREYQTTLLALAERPREQWTLCESWLTGYVRFHALPERRRFIPEAVAYLLTETQLEWRKGNATLDAELAGLLGDHPRIVDGQMRIEIDDFMQRLDYHRSKVLPEYRHFLSLRQQVIKQERQRLRLDDFVARPLSSFVRNQLLNDVYLPIIGDNLAKQMGALGNDKRSDLMGLLLLISPPGYGKTTLMEYVANRLGLIFLKINCPSLGHSVQSLDPEQAPNATARQELEKLNLGLEMGNNVMLYLDDIQHTHPEFLQKFISLCDATRRIEGVWRGQTKTYDLRGKRFCVIMAGNPYTESGEVFKIPDMLANRADIYNLGDVLSGRERQFALSYIENALTSNSALAPLATRDMADLYRLVGMAEGEPVAGSDLSYAYSAAELEEIVTVIKRLFRIRDVVLKVNKQYIASAAQADAYRTEPPFKLQGSYRNMNKMAEKVSAVMNPAELDALIRDHYIGEAQTLTTGAEENLLKLGELLGNLSPEAAARWQAIKADFQRIQGLGGDEADTGVRMLNQLSKVVSALHAIEAVMHKAGAGQDKLEQLVNGLHALRETVAVSKADVQVINQPVPGMDKVLSVLADTIETSLLPVVAAMEHKLRLDHDIWEKVKVIAGDVRKLGKTVAQQAGK